MKKVLVLGAGLVAKPLIHYLLDKGYHVSCVTRTVSKAEKMIAGYKNADADLRIIEEQEKVREAMRAELALMRERLRRGEIPDLTSPESWTARYRELDKQFDALVAKQREIIVKDQLDQIYTANGGEFHSATNLAYVGNSPFLTFPVNVPPSSRQSCLNKPPK